ncbi:hypothetical protein Bca101_056232 [Brassica carinata]
MDPWVQKQEKREMKKNKKHYDMLQFVCDAQHGIPSSCPCGGFIIIEVSTNPADKDWLPGQRYFTCSAYKNDGLHFRQPWVNGVEEEVCRLKSEVAKMAVEIAHLKDLITHLWETSGMMVCDVVLFSSHLQ